MPQIWMFKSGFSINRNIKKYLVMIWNFASRRFDCVCVWPDYHNFCARLWIIHDLVFIDLVFFIYICKRVFPFFFCMRLNLALSMCIGMLMQRKATIGVKVKWLGETLFRNCSVFFSRSLWNVCQANSTCMPLAKLISKCCRRLGTWSAVVLFRTPGHTCRTFLRKYAFRVETYFVVISLSLFLPLSISLCVFMRFYFSSFFYSV